MLTELIKKLIRLLTDRKIKEQTLLIDYALINETTILKNGLSLRFDTEKEKRKYVEIGEKGIIGANFIFESPKGYVKIGNNVHIGSANFISRSSIEVGNDVTMAWDIMLYDHDSHSIFWEYRQNDNKKCYTDYMTHNKNNVVNKDWSYVKSAPIKICDKVWIGFGVTILKGVTIGDGAVVGAKSVITRDVPAWVVVAGNPAKIIKEIPFNLRGNK